MKNTDLHIGISKESKEIAEFENMILSWNNSEIKTFRIASEYINTYGKNALPFLKFYTKNDSNILWEELKKSIKSLLEPYEKMATIWKEVDTVINSVVKKVLWTKNMTQSHWKELWQALDGLSLTIKNLIK